MKLRLKSLLRSLFDKDSDETDLDAEVRACVNMVADEKIAAGVPPVEARRRALAEYGGIEPVKQSVRDVRSGVKLENFLQDVRFGIRQLGRNPVFAIAAVLMLGIGIGANTAIFAFVNSVLLRPYHTPTPID